VLARIIADLVGCEQIQELYLERSINTLITEFGAAKHPSEMDAYILEDLPF
jgi:hypothetical protein